VGSSLREFKASLAGIKTESEDIAEAARTEISETSDEMADIAATAKASPAE
jgi:Sec-independent protein translocase protein TatA